MVIIKFALEVPFHGSSALVTGGAANQCCFFVKSQLPEGAVNLPTPAVAPVIEQISFSMVRMARFIEVVT
jgi:hypothetical protein